MNLATRGCARMHSAMLPPREELSTLRGMLRLAAPAARRAFPFVRLGRGGECLFLHDLGQS